MSKFLFDNMKSNCDGAISLLFHFRETKTFHWNWVFGYISQTEHEPWWLTSLRRSLSRKEEITRTSNLDDKITKTESEINNKTRFEWRPMFWSRLLSSLIWRKNKPFNEINQPPTLLLALKKIPMIVGCLASYFDRLNKSTNNETVLFLVGVESFLNRKTLIFTEFSDGKR